MVDSLEARSLDGIVVTSPYNTFYLWGFKGFPHKSDEPRPYAVILSRHQPDHPVLVVADYYVSSLSTSPPGSRMCARFGAVMLPPDLPPGECDLDRFLPQAV
ncbi:MAG: hypothetical protein CM1200mP20_08940 [Pseudomonadota bacterium]|nr:MAG: hypothetical protein CM1200mP20_08940 [Pseudomonadota bacterium]